MKNLKIADDVHREIRIHAAKEGKTVAALADKILRLVLAMPAAKKGK